MTGKVHNYYKHNYSFNAAFFKPSIQLGWLVANFNLSCDDTTAARILYCNNVFFMMFVVHRGAVCLQWYLTVMMLCDSQLIIQYIPTDCTDLSGVIILGF